jgi:hypothetical protein
MFKKILFVSLVFFCPLFIFADSGLPFKDVSPSDYFYNDLKTLYDAGIISDSVDGNFNPDASLGRDVFV